MLFPRQSWVKSNFRVKTKLYLKKSRFKTEVRRSQGARWQMKSLNLWSVQLVQAGGDWAGGLGPYSLRTLPRIVQPLTRWEKTPHRLNAELLLLTEAARRSACQNFSSLADMQTPRAALPLTWGSAEAQSRTADWLEMPPGDYPAPLFSPAPPTVAAELLTCFVQVDLVPTGEDVIKLQCGQSVDKVAFWPKN